MTVLIINSYYNLQKLVPARVPPMNPTKNWTTHEGGGLRNVGTSYQKVRISRTKTTFWKTMPSDQKLDHAWGAVTAECWDKLPKSEDVSHQNPFWGKHALRPKIGPRMGGGGCGLLGLYRRLSRFRWFRWFRKF